MTDTPHKILVTGSRKWTDWNLLEVTLRDLAVPGAVLMHGGAEGVDRMAGYIWREKFGLPVVVVKADWKKYGKAAGYIRNEKMVLSGPDIVVAFILDKSAGASHCLQFAKQKGLQTVEFHATSEDGESDVNPNDEVEVDPFASQIL